MSAGRSQSGPNDGHTFEISVRLRGSYGVVGEPDSTDAEDFSPLKTVEVRAWNLREAFRKAADLPLADFFPPEPDDASR